MMKINDIATYATGNWPFILTALAIEVPRQPNKHSACPACGGKDRFRFDDKEGRGTFICNKCGAGDGFSLVASVFNESISSAAKQVASVLGLSESQMTNEYSPVIKQFRNQYAQVQDRQEKQLKAKRCKAIEQAKELFKKCRRATENNSYLARKQCKPFTALELRESAVMNGKSFVCGTLVIPLYSSETKDISSLQMIPSDGKKYMLAGGAVRGGFYPLFERKVATSRHWIAEGFATASSVAEVTGEPTACAFMANNLIHVAKAFRVSLPKAQIVIVADNDSNGTGLREAEKAAKAINGQVFLASSLQGGCHGN